MSGIFWILFLLFVKSIQPTACFKCVNTQRGVVEQTHHYLKKYFFFCQTVVTDVRIFKRKEEESQKKYVALLVFEMIQQTRWARYFLHFISFKRVSVLPFYPISSSLYSPSIPYPPLRVLVTGGGRRDNIFPLLDQSAGPDPLSKVQVHRTANKMHRPTIKKTSKNDVWKLWITVHRELGTWGQTSFRPSRPHFHPLIGSEHLSVLRKGLCKVWYIVVRLSGGSANGRISLVFPTVTG